MSYICVCVCVCVCIYIYIYIYIYGVPCKARNFNIINKWTYVWQCLKAITFYLLHNVSTLNECRKFSCVTLVCKHFASYQDYPNYKLDLIW
jgi:hypothetical protein